MLIFESITTFEFEEKKDLKEFVKMLPLSKDQKMYLLAGSTVIDREDEVAVTGAANTIHQFTIKEED